MHEMPSNPTGYATPMVPHNTARHICLVEVTRTVSFILPMTNDELILRDYQEEKDLKRVQAIFADGMITLAPVLANILTRDRLMSPTWGHPFILAGLSSTVVMSLLGNWMVPSSKFMTTRAPQAVITYVGSVALLLSAGYHTVHHVVTRGRFQEYIDRSLTNDLANISSVYQSNGGLFLVAVTKDKGVDRVVGMVGAEFKETTTSDGNVYELRRMSVDVTVRGRGIGQRLVEELEQRLPVPCKIILYTSNLQYAAHRLYEKLGYTKEGIENYGNWPSKFEIWCYVKHLGLK